MPGVLPNDRWLVTDATMSVHREYTLLGERDGESCLAVFVRREFVVSAWTGRQIDDPPFAHIINGGRLFYPIKNGNTRRFILPSLSVLPSSGTYYVDYIPSTDYQWSLDRSRQVRGKDQESWRTYIDFSGAWDAYLLEGIYTIDLIET